VSLISSFLPLNAVIPAAPLRVVQASATLRNIMTCISLGNIVPNMSISRRRAFDTARACFDAGAVSDTCAAAARVPERVPRRTGSEAALGRWSAGRTTRAPDSGTNVASTRSGELGAMNGSGPIAPWTSSLDSCACAAVSGGRAGGPEPGWPSWFDGGVGITGGKIADLVDATEPDLDLEVELDDKANKDRSRACPSLFDTDGSVPLLIPCGVTSSPALSSPLFSLTDKERSDERERSNLARMACFIPFFATPPSTSAVSARALVPDSEPSSVKGAWTGGPRMGGNGYSAIPAGAAALGVPPPLEPSGAEGGMGGGESLSVSASSRSMKNMRLELEPTLKARSLARCASSAPSATRDGGDGDGDGEVEAECRRGRVMVFALACE